MKKTLSLILVLLLSFGTVIGSSCSNESGPNTVVVQSTYNNLKVMQEGEYIALGQKIDVVTHKGDTESGQLIVTPQKDVRSFVLNIENLTLQDNPTVVFSKENIKVYMQKYINVTVKTAKNENMNYPVGYTPDMLLPQESAIEYSENFIKARKNQGITIEFTTNAQTQAGIYTGDFELICDGVSYAIPVTLEVYDITVEKSYGMTCMVASAQYTMTGEYDTSKESYKRYFEKALNEYKFMLELLPNSIDPEKMAESAVYYWDNPHFTSFNIPNRTYTSGIFEIANQLQLGPLYEYFWELAMHSEPNMILFEKAYIYLKHIDEAMPDKYGVVADSMQDVYDVEDKVFADLESSGYFDKYSAEYKAEFEKRIKGVPIILTGDSSQVSALGTKVNTYCSRIDGLNTPAQRQMFEEVEANNVERGGKTWFYTCMEPVYPMPSHHIDDTLLGSRTMRWMQKEWNLEGYLYWQTFSYAKWTGSETVTIDPYEDPVRFPNINGDGYLAYPGKKYGLDNFLPSIRMTAFRDGQEDLDLLCTFEEMLKEKARYFGLDESTVSSNLYLEEFYSQLYTGAVASDDVALFENIKRQVYDLIFKHKSSTNFYVVKNVNNLTATSDIYLSNVNELTVNGAVLTGTPCGNGVKYTVVQDLANKAELNVVIKKDGQTVEKHNIYVAPKTVKATINQDTISVSENSSVQFVNDKLKVKLVSWGEGRELIMNKPFVTFSKETLDDVKLNKLDSISFTITNNSPYSITFDTMFISGSTRYLLNEYTLQAGETRTITTSKINEYSGVFSRLSSANFALNFINYYKDDSGTNVKYPDRDFTIENVQYSYARGN